MQTVAHLLYEAWCCQYEHFATITSIIFFNQKLQLETILKFYFECVFLMHYTYFCNNSVSCSGSPVQLVLLLYIFGQRTSRAMLSRDVAVHVFSYYQENASVKPDDAET